MYVRYAYVDSLCSNWVLWTEELHMGRDPTFLSALMGEGKKRGDQVNRDKVAGVAPTQQLLYSSHNYLVPWSVQWKKKKKKTLFQSLFILRQFI